MRAHHEADFRDFAAAYQHDLRRYAYLLCGDWHEAEDATQKGLIAVYMNWRKLDRDGRVRAYARVAVLNAVRDHRSSARYRREDHTGVIPETAVSDSYNLGDRENLLAALRALPLRMRAVVVLRYWEGLSVEETADALGCAPGNVKALASRGCAKLREALAGSDS